MQVFHLGSSAGSCHTAVQHGDLMSALEQPGDAATPETAAPDDQRLH